ncbi:DUF2059 domain-containing protein [Hwanghaeella sp.]|uniref:DUF2059 domain-containing protein n=1 Tax=Hwanghaeella sp. TaxID=2605943 RepID=UPI003CCBB7A4
MKRVIALTFLLLTLPFAAAQAEPASEASIREYLRLTDFRRAIDPITANITSQAARQLRTQNPAIADSVLQNVAASIHQVVTENIGSYENAVIAQYQQLLTEEEVRAANAFFSSPAGQGFAQKLPQFSQAAGRAAQQWLQSINPQLQEAVKAAVGQ